MAGLLSLDNILCVPSSSGQNLRLWLLASFLFLPQVVLICFLLWESLFREFMFETEKEVELREEYCARRY